MISVKKETIMDYYVRGELKRIAWKIQYKAKVTSKHELPLKSENVSRAANFQNEVDRKLYVEYLINSIPTDIGRKIIFEIYINEKTEVQVAKELNISQQGVNQWKRKTLKYLCQKMSS